MTGRKSIPQPFNENDVTIWNALVCKHVCQYENTSFNESEFLGAVIDDKTPLGAYDKEMMKKTRDGEQNEYHLLMKFCLEFLRKNRLLEIKKEMNSKGLHEVYFAGYVVNIAGEK
jgi:hypothetical protein